MIQEIFEKYAVVDDERTNVLDLPMFQLAVDELLKAQRELSAKLVSEALGFSSSGIDNEFLNDAILNAKVTL